MQTRRLSQVILRRATALFYAKSPGFRFFIGDPAGPQTPASPILLSLAALAACTCASAVESQSVDDIVDFLGKQTKGEYAASRYGNLLVVTAPASQNSPYLYQRVTVDFDSSQMADVAQFIRDVSSLNVVCAPGVLISDKAVTLKATDMRLEQLLKWITKLTNFEISWVDGALYISDTPIQRPSQMKIYDLSDLVMPIQDFPGPAIALFEKPFGK